MPPLDETEWWIRVYETIKRISPGRVTPYKHIGVLLGTRMTSLQIIIAELRTR